MNLLPKALPYRVRNYPVPPIVPLNMIYSVENTYVIIAYDAPLIPRENKHIFF
jgi:hypothetical protein